MGLFGQAFNHGAVTERSTNCWWKPRNLASANTCFFGVTFDAKKMSNSITQSSLLYLYCYTGKPYSDYSYFSVFFLVFLKSPILTSVAQRSLLSLCCNTLF